MMEEKLPELPKGWVWVKLEDLSLKPKEDIVDGPFGSNLKAEEYTKQGAPVIRLQNIDRCKFKDKNIKFINIGKAKKLNRHSFKENDIIMTKLGMPLGKACLVPSYLDWGIIVADVVRVRIEDKYFDKNFLVYLINSPFVSHQLAEKTKGTTRPRVNLGHIKNLILPYPPFFEQQRIVEKIEELFTRLDAGIESLKKVQTQMKRYRQAVLKHAFEGNLTAAWRETNKHHLDPASALLESFKEERKKSTTGKQKDLPPLNASELPELPEGWAWYYLSDIGELNRGKSKHRPRNDKKLFGGNYPFIQTGDIKNSFGVVRSYTQTYNVLGLKQSRLWPANTLCITIAANIAEVAILGIQACFPDSIVGFSPNDQISDAKFIYYYFMVIKKQIESNAPATAQKNINLDTLKKIPVPLPSISEQQKIVEEIDSRFSIADRIEEIVEQNLKKAERLRQSILKKAFEGKLVPQDTSDEPAGVLLERIKVEKQKEEAKKTNSKGVKTNVR